MNASPCCVVDFVNGADVGMVQCGSGLGFPLKAAERLRVFGNVVGQELESHETTELNVLGLVHDTHTTAAQLLNNAVVRDGLADHSCRNLTWAKPGKSIQGVELPRLLRDCVVASPFHSSAPDGRISMTAVA